MVYSGQEEERVPVPSRGTHPRRLTWVAELMARKRAHPAGRGPHWRYYHATVERRAIHVRYGSSPLSGQDLWNQTSAGGHQMLHVSGINHFTLIDIGFRDETDSGSHGICRKARIKNGWARKGKTVYNRYLTLKLFPPPPRPPGPCLFLAWLALPGPWWAASALAGREQPVFGAQTLMQSL